MPSHPSFLLYLLYPEKNARAHLFLVKLFSQIFRTEIQKWWWKSYVNYYRSITMAITIPRSGEKSEARVALLSN